MSEQNKPFLSRVLSHLGLGAVRSEHLLGKQPGQEWDGNGLEMKLCWCPPGTFTMGSPRDEPERSANEGQSQVTLSTGFWLGKYEVTQGEWKSLMGKNPSAFSAEGKARDQVAGQETDRFPVEVVSWAEAAEFCKKLTDEERRRRRLPDGWVYRLPTEAQWEYGCRAGTAAATAFGNKLSSTQANFDGDYPYNGADKGPALRRTLAVGSYPPNAWGICDMHGNVSEWCLDWYVEHISGGNDPEVSSTNEALIRTIRGGSAIQPGRDCRSAERSGSVPSSRSSTQGFRVALAPVGEKTRKK